MALTTLVGEAIKNKTNRKLPLRDNVDSIWFPHGPLGFGGHYRPGQIRQFMDEMTLEELGAKGIKLRVIVGGIAMTIIGGGSYFLG